MSTTFQDFTGSVPKDARYHCLTVKQAHFDRMTSASGTEVSRAAAAAEESDETKLDEILGLVRNINDGVQNEINGAVLQASSLVFRTLDGSGNNLANPTWGKMDIPLVRNAPSDYDPSGDVAKRGASNPNPRIVSNSICKGTSIPSSVQLSDMMWAWGQFLDHEISITHTQESPEYPVPEKLNMVTPTVAEDPNEDFPERTIPFTRSVFSTIGGVREQPNQISSFIDTTNVYGSDVPRGYALRMLDGTGKLKTTIADNGEVLPPYNTDGLPNAAPSGSIASEFFLCGDIRSNEQALLTAMHTLFIREHNRMCDVIASNNPSYVEEQIYQKARRCISGYMQQITCAEFLPTLLGQSFPCVVPSYSPSVNASMSTEFSTVGYRIGHTMVSSDLALGPTASASVPLRDVFFTPSYIQANGCDELLIGATKQVCQEIDGILVEDLRSFLFGPPTVSMMHDLASLNIQRGRDHGIPGYNDMREAYGLSRISDFSSLPTSSANQLKLQNLYDSVDDIDPWVAGIVENHLPGGSVGPLFFQIIKTQFNAFKAGDRFWYENDPALSDAEKNIIKNTTLRDIMIRNTQYSASDFNANVFLVV